MYVIGTNEWNFLYITSRTMMEWTSCKTWNEIEKVTYGCCLNKATIFPNYEFSEKIINEIKLRKNKIIFENYSIIGEILDREHGKEFDVNALKIYNLAPLECKTEQ